MFNKTFIIVEAGVNHNGNIDYAYKLIDIAKTAGADAIKFQSFIAEDEISRFAKKADYQKVSNIDNQSQLDMVKNLELSFSQQILIMKYCYKKRIQFISSPFDISSINFLYKHKLNIIKIPSSEIDNVPYLEVISKKFKNIILSTGMSNIKEIKFALDILNNGIKKNISLLHCVSAYPTPKTEVNLNIINKLSKLFNLNVGFSDHTIGIDIPVYAVYAGAKIIEKHFTLNKNLRGPDHKISLSPKELNKMIQNIRAAEKILGSYYKNITISEKPNFKIVRKSIVAKVDIKKGDKFSKLNITTKRPRNGVSPIFWNKLLGKRSKYNYKHDQPIKENEI